ncbi:anchored repeat-type ABC transporter permease subunit [Propionimicrobium lymphophilum]|uniref:Anchored repeat-type ABC transporter, permease subunit n=1 Tax=Propionimicrobium lymphophilum ACS-093-V-SCH5 TaxID=883161 RepID=S2WW79_9ACTN|nr:MULTISPECIES: anchored repeat-type ABC transporter permease subunit [Propionimicrobium]EPD31989.1 anchored repeat-type ABC transporter, permease subunit [Propionimicrobium lymphophilum ACS-093-V-SCH5]ETJ98086.1 anchored repeat-type ABC transporter, permease subunit [Propionimicrobium sp. BV2F7]MDK7710153.1 anchored repeat-type ABC transporter permease subunit [Propionimicrobium lymphophilum]MDK7734168.1 anchored repeat-type ABC transporter permease subunit [Propionimicrobium lymphophilum]
MLSLKVLTPIEFVQDLTNPLLSFLPKALIVTVACSLIAGFIGTYVVLRGMAFIGDAVAHSVFPGLAIAFVLQGSLILGGVAAGLATAVLVTIFSQNRRLKEDSVIGILFVSAFALGIVILSRAPGYSGSLQSFLFGSITGISDSDVTGVLVAALVIFVVALAFNKELIAVSLDRESAKASRLPVFWLDLLLYSLVTMVVVIAVQSVGNILVLALLVTPASTARLLTDRIGVMMSLAPLIGALSAVVGSYLSWAVDLPAGGSIVLTSTAIFLITWVLAPKHGLLAKTA